MDDFGGQGLASCSVSLIRLSSGDVALGMIAWAPDVLASLLKLLCQHKRVRQRADDGTDRSEVTAYPLDQFLKLANRSQHWKDISTTQFKQRHLLLIDNL